MTLTWSKRDFPMCLPPLRQVLFFVSNVLCNPMRWAVLADTEETHPSHSCSKTTGGDNYAADCVL